jgi:hypothetical protein
MFAMLFLPKPPVDHSLRNTKIRYGDLDLTCLRIRAVVGSCEDGN